MTYLGMQVMVEGLALAAFGFMHKMTEEPLLKQLLRYVMSDEARHVAFGVLSLKEVYDGMTDAEMKERQEFAFEAAVRMRDRSSRRRCGRSMGVNPSEVVPLVLATRCATCSSRCCSPRSCPTARSSACSTATTWLRRRFEEMGVIQFEDWEDTGRSTSSSNSTARLADHLPVVEVPHPETRRQGVNWVCVADSRLDRGRFRADVLTWPPPPPSVRGKGVSLTDCRRGMWVLLLTAVVLCSARRSSLPPGSCARCRCGSWRPSSWSAWPNAPCVSTSTRILLGSARYSDAALVGRDRVGGGQ